MGVVIGIVVGLIGGSAMTALSFRIQHDMPLVLDRSRCPSCGHLIRAYDNVPILAYLWLRGHCRDCKVAIPIRYPLIEIAGAIIGVVAARCPVDAIAQVGCGFALLVGLGAALIDLETYRIPNRLTYPSALILVVLGLANGFSTGQWHVVDATFGLALVVLVFFVLLRIVSRGGMGLGDAKLAVVLTLGLAPLGLAIVAVAVLVSFLIGSIIGVGLIFARRASLRAKLPFGPFLAVGFLITALGTGIYH
jgi:leader peptidase (prepilin peptidase)/N-methyltransferase